MSNVKKSNTSERLKQLMEERDLKQIDILRLTAPYCEKYKVKMNKSDISQYTSGKVEPNQNKLFVLSNALNVNEAWLMGYDVPMERTYVSDEKIGEIFHEDMQHPLNNSEMARFLSGANAVLEEMFEDKLQKQQLEEFNQKLKERLPKDLGMPKQSTLAAHFSGDEYTEDELDEIKQFAEFVKNKRK